MTATEERARSIFMSALDRAPDEWAALLDVACGGDAELKARVGQLLHAHRAIGSIHGGGLNDRTLGGAMPDDAPGTQIGPYKLLEQIGEGGMGLVFVAEQERPVRRQVALKVIKPGMDTREVIARFEAERQALALFDHPHIARVLDAGATALGRPFFVMELVRGIPITDYCDRARLGVGERLKLFVQICQAVQHAHQKGVIHRDLKPSNVLVTEHDATPVAKVIDFGVAKAVGQRLTDKTVYTRFLRMVGSPLYMSPEQAGLSGLDIDTRADIYSLGVILYELLTGTTPFDADRLREAEFDEVRKIIQEEEPARPSSRLSTLGQAADTVSANRGSDPRRLCRLCQGELDWIVMRCLEKDRNRRYESAVALANDVERHLLDEPVQASPPSRWYRTRKFVRRNRRALVSAAALGVALMVAVGAVAGSIGWAMRDRAARESEADRELESALQSAASLRDRGNWVEAREVVKRAEWLLADGRHETEQQQIRAIVADLDMATRLEEIRLTDPGTGWLILSRAGVDAPYTEAFKAYGIDVAALDVPTAAERISASAIRALLVTALHDWM
jgi:eukaryotic-like serine/threonine-protein kinase